ncbi:uncharacterized protein [Palaemon carinicauda]|uniref:uncharacterized protein n=1 Tax=Palaemon carinicauda TaxID=392227 RepID=UPI0035B6703B
MASTITMDMIKPFPGEGDVVSWLKKVTLVAKLQKIVDLASFIPLYLEGDALALYLEMGDEDQECAAKIQEKLKVTFSDDPFSAFGKLVQLKWTGEPVDVYANEIRRLTGLAKFDKVGLENVVNLTFVNGFPDNISVALQQLPNVMTMAMSKLISHARILSSKQQGGEVAVTLLAGTGCGKRVRGDCCACSRLFDDKKVHLDTLPIIDVWIGIETAKGLVATGCSTSVVHSKFVPRCKGEVYISAFDGSHIKFGQEIKHRLGSEKDNNSSTVVIEDPDFHARFGGEKWTVRWFWENNETVTLKNKVSCYDEKLDGWKKEEFEKEVDRWIAEGILVPWKEKVDVGIIPLMAVEQPTKNKVRPVFYFRELNVNVKCHTDDDVTDVCSETLRKWRQTGENASVVDLKILKTVLSKSEKKERPTSSYIDDILVNESIATADEGIRHLNTFELITKSPESLNGSAALGLQLQRVEGELMFQRDNKVPEVADMLTRRELFSVCGTLVGHYPIAGWLRIACSYIKRRAYGARWEDPVGEQSMMIIKEVIEGVKLDDPVRGNWCVPSVKHGVVWCDASKIAMGVALEINGKIAEDAAWLRKKDDFNHINVTEQKLF